MNSTTEIISKIKNTISHLSVTGISFIKNVSSSVLGLKNGRSIARKHSRLERERRVSLSKKRIPSFSQMKYIKKFLNPKELLIIKLCFFTIFCSALFISGRFIIGHLQVVPVKGGEYVEGVIGTPKHINPLYASVSDVDSDISSLIYSSLYKRGKNGEPVKDLVESFELSEDGKIYTFTIKQGVKWHNAEELTVDDIVFTFQAIKDPQYESPLRQSFLGVEIERINERKFRFILSDSYAPFLNLLDFGILPAELWYSVSPNSANLSSLNIEPIGSGPYLLSGFLKDKRGNIKEYKLIPNEEYFGEVPLVDITFKFFADSGSAVDALNNGLVDGLSYLDKESERDVIVPKKLNLHKLFIPQLTTIFLNDKTNVALGDKSLRKALAYSIDRNRIINEVLGGDAFLVNSPILPNSFAYSNEVSKYDYSIEKANELLEGIDWKLVEITDEDIAEAEANIATDDENLQEIGQKVIDQGKGKWRKKNNKYLVIRITTVERSENEQVVQLLKDFWEEIGVKTILEIVPPSRMNGEVIRTRDFEALFYGQVVGADPDPYAFWHSSQTGETGFNISGFANKDVDRLLEEGRKLTDLAKRQEKYREFQKIITEELPSIFMYSPMYTYAQNRKIKGFDVTNILVPSDRFLNVENWYIKTGKKLIW